PSRQVSFPLRSALDVCHRHTAPPNGHASMSAWLVARGNKKPKTALDRKTFCQGRFHISIKYDPRCHLDSWSCHALYRIPSYPRQLTYALRRRILSLYGL